MVVPKRESAAIKTPILWSRVRHAFNLEGIMKKLAEVVCVFLAVGILSPLVAAQRSFSFASVEGNPPVRIQGVVKPFVSPSQSVRLDGSIINVSREPILLVVFSVRLPAMLISDPDAKAAAVETTGERKETRSTDYFFASNHFGPGSSENFVINFHPFRDLENNQQTVLEPHPEGTVLFVQFESGSTWGDKSAASDGLSKRERTVEYLRRLARINEVKGSEEFLRELLTDTDLPQIKFLQASYLSTKNLPAVLEDLYRRIDNADRSMNLISSGRQE